MITNKGKPAALMLRVSAEDFDTTLQAVRQAKAMIAYDNMRSRAALQGYMSEQDMTGEIAAARRGE